jgi:hypothetical protein
MKNLGVIFLLFFLILDSYAQKIATKQIYADPFYDFDNLILVENGAESFIISKHKTSNREYLCFMEWTYKVYSDYLEVYRRIIPDTLLYPDIFDPTKANEPVKGISQLQAIEYCQWRSDRLNEYILIREGLLLADNNQINNYCFNTESYLSNQYEGLVNKYLYDVDTKGARKVIYNDFYLLPGYYIASHKQIMIADSLIKISKTISSKKIESELDWWMKHLLKSSLTANDYSPYKSFISKLPKDQYSSKKKIHKLIKTYQKELAIKPIKFDHNCMTSTNDFQFANLRNLKAYLRYYNLLCDSLPNPFTKNQIIDEIKDNFGKLSYYYIGDNEDGTPILINKSVFAEDVSKQTSNTGFYCAMNLSQRINIEIKKYMLRLPYAYSRYRY